MSFIITLDKTINDQNLTAWWSLGESKPVVTSKILKFEAKGNEFDFINKVFFNLPVRAIGFMPEENKRIIPGTHSCIWNGETAQFLYDNL